MIWRVRLCSHSHLNRQTRSINIRKVEATGLTAQSRRRLVATRDPEMPKMESPIINAITSNTLLQSRAMCSKKAQSRAQVLIKIETILTVNTDKREAAEVSVGTQVSNSITVKVSIWQLVTHLLSIRTKALHRNTPVSKVKRSITKTLE